MWVFFFFFSPPPSLKADKLQRGVTGPQLTSVSELKGIKLHAADFPHTFSDHFTPAVSSSVVVYISCKRQTAETSLTRSLFRAQEKFFSLRDTPTLNLLSLLLAKPGLIEGKAPIWEVVSPGGQSFIANTLSVILLR